MSVWPNIFFTSDLHFWHSNVIKFCNRPWATAEEMNEGIIANWNATVGDDDLIYILGDMFFCGTTKLLAIMKRLRGHKHLILGNHDWGKVKRHRAQEFGFDAVVDTDHVMLGGTEFILSHFPYEGDHMETERFVEYRPKDDGGWLLHGHVHCSWKINKKQINVGVDVWDYKPVHSNQILELVR